MRPEDYDKRSLGGKFDSWLGRSSRPRDGASSLEEIRSVAVPEENRTMAEREASES